LTIGTRSASIGPVLNPAAPATSDQNLAAMYAAYGSLIIGNLDGSYSPSPTVQSFGYVRGSHNKVFRLTLKPGVKFSDGSPLNAQALVKYWKVFKAKAGLAVYLSAVKTIKALNATTVELRLSTADPDLPYKFSQGEPAGMVVCPAALKHPSVLVRSSCGSGPYKLLGSQTVLGDHYTFVPNSNYPDKKLIKWNKVVVRLIDDFNAQLQALKTGQLDAYYGPANLARDSGAAAAGLSSVKTPDRIFGLWLLDRDGKLLPALKDVRVRQALNYAIDRNAITHALVGSYGYPTVQNVSSSHPAYDKTQESYYKYDPVKAKSLLAAAGYSNGFDLVLPEYAPQFDQLAQAVQPYLQAIGLKVTIKSFAGAADYYGNVTAADPKFPVAFFPENTQPTNVFGIVEVTPNAYWNPFHTSDSVMNGLLNQVAQASDRETSTKLAQRLGGELVKKAWTAPIYALDAVVDYNPKVVSNVKFSAIQSDPNWFEWNPAK
jgi:peptide/nickel transport system substrate-binding protein